MKKSQQTSSTGRLIDNWRHNRERVQRQDSGKYQCCVEYLNLMHLSDLVHCDGRTLSEDLLKASGRLVTKVTFPKEKTTRNDKSLWRQFLDTLNDGCNTSLEPLGEYISPPYIKLHWQYNQVSINLLCSNFDSTKHNVYEQQTIERRIRSGPVYERTRTEVDPVKGSHYTHVISNGDDRVKLHSRVSKYV